MADERKSNDGGVQLQAVAGPNGGLIKALFAACAGGATVSVSPVDGGMPFGATVALPLTKSNLLYGGNAVARYFALAAGVLRADDLQVDKWLEWEAAHLCADVDVVAAALADGTAKFPLTDSDVRAAVLARDEKVNAMRYKAGAKATATTPAAVVYSVQRLATALSTLDAALSTSRFLVGSQVTLADVAVFGSLHVLASNNVLPLEEFGNVSRYFGALSQRGDAKHAIETAAAAATSAVGLQEVTQTTSMLSWLGDAFSVAIWKAFPGSQELGLSAQVTPAAAGGRFNHHYQCNSCMKVAALMKAGSPRAAAEAVVAAFPSTPVVGKLEIAGPGFINIYMSDSFLADRVRHVASSGLQPPATKVQKVVVDYSSPNIAKEMHVGHLRSTIIGDTIARILEYLGHDVKRVNHVGDWGTQFGMLIAHMKDTGATAGGDASIADLTALYKAAKVRFGEDADFAHRAHLETFKLQDGDEENRRLWKALCGKSEEMFMSVYRRLGIDSRLEVCGESFYQPYIPGVIKMLEEKGLLKESDGAKVAFVREGDKPPLMIVKSDGAVGYDSTDMACIWYRSQQLKADRLVYVVDAGQADHFENVFAGAEKAGWLQHAKPEHVKFGVVQGEDGKKFKTRSGETVKLVDLLDKARDLCRADLQKRAAEGGAGTLVDESDFGATAEALGYGGVKYFDLRQNRTTDYKFSYKKMLAHNGDTAVYMQYAHARIASIGRKAGVDPATVDPAVLALEHESESKLAFLVTRFQEVLAMVEDDLMPHHLCEYLWKLANQFSDFYNNCRVVGDDKQASRLVLCHAVARVFRKCMVLLGINPIDRL